MKKYILSLILVVVSMSMVFAGGSADSSSADNKGKIVIEVGSPKAPPILPVLKMIEDKAMGDDVSIKIKYWKTAEEMVATVVEGKRDFYALPLTAVSKLYNKGFPIQLTNVNTWGPVYLLSTDTSVKSWKDLKGKTVYVQCKDSPAHVMTQILLKDAGLKQGECKVDPNMAKMELANWLILGNGDYAVMIEPLASKVLKKNKKMKVVMSFEDEWKRVRKTNNRLPHAGFVVSKKFAKEHKDLVSKFNKEFEKALNWVVSNPAEAGALAEAKLGMKKKMIESSIPKMGLEYKNISEVEDQIKDFYKFFFQFNKKTVGGKLPDNGLYLK